MHTNGIQLKTAAKMVTGKALADICPQVHANIGDTNTVTNSEIPEE